MHYNLYHYMKHQCPMKKYIGPKSNFLLLDHGPVSVSLITQTAISL